MPKSTKEHPHTLPNLQSDAELLPLTERESYEELEREIYSHLESSLRDTINLIDAVERKVLRLDDIPRAVARLEASVLARVNAIQDSISTVEARPLQKDLRFIVRVFSITYRNLLLRYPPVGDPYRTLYKRRKAKHGHIHVDNAINIDSVRITQHLVWSILRNPVLDPLTKEPIVLKRFDETLERMFGTISDTRGRNTRESFRSLKQGIIAHAAARSWMEEQGQYLSAPPEPILDAEWGIDLIAIDQKGFLDKLRTLEEKDPNSVPKNALIDRVGSYGNGNPAKAGWIEAMRAYPSLQKMVTLVQVKSHRTGFKFDAIKNNGNNKEYISPRIPHLTDSVMLRSTSRFSLNDSRHLSRTIRDAHADFTRMHTVLPHAHYAYIDLSYHDALKIIARRAQ